MTTYATTGIPMLPGELAPAAVLDLSPQALADALDTLFTATLESDREVACILKTAREGLRNLSYNRYAARHTRAARARIMRRRYQGVRS